MCPSCSFIIKVIYDKDQFMCGERVPAPLTNKELVKCWRISQKPTFWITGAEPRWMDLVQSYQHPQWAAVLWMVSWVWCPSATECQHEKEPVTSHIWILPDTYLELEGSLIVHLNIRKSHINWWVFLQLFTSFEYLKFCFLKITSSDKKRTFADLPLWWEMLFLLWKQSEGSPEPDLSSNLTT